MGVLQCIVFTTLLSVSLSQRPSYAGNRPIGYPVFDEESFTSAYEDPVTRRSQVTTTTERLPLEASGDRNLFERLRKLPMDKQPFWLLNWQKMEENRNQPKTYSFKPNSYLDPITTSSPYHPKLIQRYYPGLL